MTATSIRPADAARAVPPPGSRGWRMPAEWEPHAATWISWPHKLDTWPGKFEPIPGVFARMVAALQDGEAVRILVADEALEASARSAIGRAAIAGGNVEFFRIPTDDAWIRDHGPIFLVNHAGERVVLDWIFNSWGGKYGPWDHDDAVPTRIAERLGLPVIAPGMVLEGGSIDVNGRGTLLTTESCLLHPNRNPGLAREEIEQRLRDHLGVTNVLWLGEGIAGDDTDGHVDDLARFVAPSTVVTVVEEDPADPNYHALRDNLARLRAMKDETGRPLDVVTLGMPRPIFHEGTRLPASYANFYVGNRAVLVPTFADPADDPACATLGRLFPRRRIVPVPCGDMVWGLGAVHCATQQEPLAPLTRDSR